MPQKKFLKNGLKRVQFEFTKAQIARAEELLEELNVSILNQRQLFLTAGCLLNWAVEERKRGRIVVSRDPHNGQIHPVLFPPLEGIVPTIAPP